MTLIIVLWVLCGLVPYLIAVVAQYRDGGDFIAEHLFHGVVLVIMGPIAPIIFIIRILNIPDLVLVKGKSKKESK